MNKLDEPTLARRKSDGDERDELLKRKRWLLLHHPDFQKELREVEKDAGIKLPLGLHPDFSNENRRAPSPYDRALDYSRYLRELDKHGTFRRGFMVKYDLLPENDKTDELAKLRYIAKDGSWYNYKSDKDTFWRDAEWYDLRLEGKTDIDILKRTLEGQGLSIDLSALDYWRPREKHS